MSVRVKVGSAILDAAETGSTSTITGVRLLTNEGPGLKIMEGPSSAQIIVPLQVSRSSTANLKTSVDALVALLTATVNADLVIEYASGSTLTSFLVSTGAWSRITCECVRNYGAKDALVLATFTAERIAPATGSAGDATDSLGPADWVFALDSNGRASATGTITFQTRADAVAWVNLVRSGTRPAWMNTAMRFTTAGWSFQQQPNQVSPVPEGAYTPATATAVFRALPADLAASGAFASINDAAYIVATKARQPIAGQAGQNPGLDVTISGSLQFKGETDATWDASDTTSTAAAAIKAAAIAAIDAIVSAAQTRRALSFTRLEEPELAIDGATGEVAFVVQAVANLPNGVLSWQETVTIKRITQNRRAAGSRIRVFPHKGGPLWKCFHSLAVSSLQLPVYSPPEFVRGANWDEDEFTPGQPQVDYTTLGTPIYTVSGSGEWTRVGTDPEAREYDFDQLVGAIA